MATLSSRQSQPVTSGWQSDNPSVATVTGAGLVTGVANGRATIYVISGGRQGQQVIRVVPDYQGQWNGGVQVTSCTQTGHFWVKEFDFCENVPVGSIDGYSLSLTQSGEVMTASLTLGTPLVFSSVAAPIAPDGRSSFTTTYVHSSGLIIDATVRLNSNRVGELTGTVNEIWHAPGLEGDARLAEDIVGTTRTSTSHASRGTSALSLGQSRSGKLQLLQHFVNRRR